MNSTSPPCSRTSDMVVSEAMLAFSGRRHLEVLARMEPIGSNTTCETDIPRDSHPKIVLPYNPLRISRAFVYCLIFVLLAWVRPVCHSGYGEQDRYGNGPDMSASGGYNPSADGFSALDSLERGCSPREPRGSKRKRGRDPTVPPSRSGSRKQAPRIFACPFYLHDRLEHSSCLYTRLTRVGDVRQHLLERTHKQVVHCPVCGIPFRGRTTAASRQQRDEHVQGATCARSPSLPNYPGITEDQERGIRETAINGRTNHFSEPQRWYMIWDVLFPEEQRPPSPYLTDPPDIQRFSDLGYAIFADDTLWSSLPEQPWTAAMGPAERRSGMLGFFGAVMALARGLVVHRAGATFADDEDHHTVVDNVSSHTGADTPDPSGAAVYLRPVSPSLASNRPADDARGPYLSPVSAAAPRYHPHNSRTIGRVEPDHGGLPADMPPIPSSPLDLDPMGLGVAQDTCQRAEPEPATVINNPVVPDFVFEDFSTEDLFDPNFDLESFLNDSTSDAPRPHDNHVPPGEGDLGGRH